MVKHEILRPALGLGLPLLVIGIFVAAAQMGQARQFRSVNPIATPERIPDGAVRAARFSPVDRQLVVRAIRSLAAAWNTGRLDPLLSRDRFYNKDRLLDTIAEVAPRDAVLKVQSVGGITTLEQYYQPVRGHNRQFSIVSAIVRTQIEFQDPTLGFTRLNGRNEFVLEIEQPAPGN